MKQKKDLQRIGLVIRQENPSDYSDVFQVVKEAFAQAEHTDHDEHHLVERLRKSAAFVPRLSLVAVLDGKIAGHIMFTEVRIGESVQLALAPVSVSPAEQDKGIGGRLIEEGHRLARLMGYEFSVLLGHAGYYPRFGYRPASHFGISAPFDVPDENFMALNLQGKDSRLNGTVQFAPEFGIE